MHAHADLDLARDIDARCRLTGEFTLRSGQVASEYFDKYLFETDPALLARVASAMAPLLPDHTDLLGGLEMGGIPIVTVVSARSGWTPWSARSTGLLATTTHSPTSGSRSDRSSPRPSWTPSAPSSDAFRRTPVLAVARRQLLVVASSRLRLRCHS
jgi:hypothetical protein